MSFPINWEFYQDTKRKWHWRRLSKTGTIAKESTKSFRLKKECLVDAKKHGYANGTKRYHLEKGNYD